MSLIGRVTSVIFSNWLAMVFYALFNVLYDIRIVGLKNYTGSPSTLITINHKRDLDIPIVASTLHLRRTPFSNKRRMYFVAREDLFQPGFLTAHFQIFGFTGPLIHKVNIKPIMRALRANPISHLIRQRIGPLIREAGNGNTEIPMKEVLSTSGIDAINTMLGGRYKKDVGDVPINEFLGYAYSALHQEPVDISIIQGKLARGIRERTLNKISGQLMTVTGILDKGAICMLAPEGNLSPDGRFWPVKSGLYRLVAMTSSDIRIIPVNTTYDFMTCGRMRIYMTVGEEFTNVKALKKMELEQLVQKSLVTIGPVTESHLGSDFIATLVENGRSEFTEQECAEAITRWVEKMRAHNVRLEERLLTEKSLKKRTRDFLKYCAKKGIIRKTGRDRFAINTAMVETDSFNKFHDDPVQYSVNELNSLLEWHNLERP